MTNETPDSIHAAVRDHYAGIARAQRGDDACCPSGNYGSLYPAEKIAELPDRVTGLSLGCGDPVSLADIRPGDIVVDLGSGGGIDCFLAAQRVGPTGRVIGIDMTPEMLERARASAARLGVTNVEFRPGTIEALPIGDAMADVVISNCVINLSPDKPQVFREMFRVLRPGGRVAVSDIVTHGRMSPLVSKGLDAWAGCVAGALDAAEYRRTLAAAGFVEVKSRPKEGAAHQILARLPAGMPYSALITARKP